TIRYTLKDRSKVCIDIYNVKGQLVRSLVNALHDSGAHSVVWDGTDNSGRALSSGVYYYRMIAADTRSTKKMILMK
ncbi:MAG: FlgD immunoglobulin-like domain containing protein, partial [Candidatus Cloacimonadaceae bacterium]|nr:FlgD immunoglobulin-like domain containing protein [Candidatus Cloacimonadaceae bacterium]